MNRRPGVTLVEVLVAIMITGIGLLALLTLFPLGALEMAQSFKDDRCGHIKHSAASIANIFSIRNEPGVVNAMLNPGGPLPSFYNPGTQTVKPGLAQVQSYPVFVDPNGYWANTGNWQNWMAGTPGLPRRVTCNPLGGTANPNSPTAWDAAFNLGTNAAYSQQQLLRWTTFLDDMTFPRDDPGGVPEGRPCVPPLGVIDRTPRYSWAYVCRMTKAGFPSLVELSVVVYSGRALNTAATGESAYSAAFAPGGTVVQLSWGAGQNAPDVVSGGWIFDATMTPDPHGYFYRVVGVTQTSPSTMDVEVQTPLKSAGSTGVNGMVVIMDNVVEVFERITRHANPVGLFSEDIDPETGALLGNFPQAYTHVGLIHAAMTIGELLEARDGRARAWT